MDLIPKPDQVVSAAGNVAHRLVYGGLADLRPMPRTLIDDGHAARGLPLPPRRGRPRPRRPGAAGDPARGAGDLLRPAPRLLAGRAPRRRRPADVPRRVRRGLVPRPQPRHGALDRGGRARPRSARCPRTPAVGPCTWSAGGSAGSSRCSRPPATPTCRSPRSTVLGAPFDVTRGAAGRAAAAAAQPHRRTRRDHPALPAAGGAPKPLVRWAFQLSSFQKLVTKPLALARHLDDADYLAQIEAVDRFTANMIAYPGRTFGQLYHRLAQGQRARRRHLRGRRPHPLASRPSPRRCWSSPARPTGSRRSRR